jgi:predicted Zn-dependent protease
VKIDLPFNIFCFVCVVTGFAGCATVGNPATQKHEQVVIDSAQEVQLGRSISENIIKHDYPLLNDPAKQLFINKIGQRLAQVCDRRDIIYRFGILDNPDLNAFSLPGGYVYITRGLFDKLNEQELAAILAHEIGHVVSRHAVGQLQSRLGYELLAAIVLAGFAQKDPQIAEDFTKLSGTVYDLLSRGYGRQEELSADRLAIKYLRLAGYDPVDMVRVLELLQKETGPKGRVFEILSDHPRMQERINKIKGY